MKGQPMLAIEPKLEVSASGGWSAMKLLQKLISNY